MTFWTFFEKAGACILLNMSICGEVWAPKICAKKSNLYIEYAKKNFYKQVKKIIKNLNKKSKTIISIFSGRMADVGKDPVPIIRKSVRITKKLKNIKILWASTREAYNYLQAKNCGCSIITMPPAIIEKISKFGKTYQELTLDTVRKFLKDSIESNFKI